MGPRRAFDAEARPSSRHLAVAVLVTEVETGTVEGGLARNRLVGAQRSLRVVRVLARNVQRSNHGEGGEVDQLRVQAGTSGDREQMVDAVATGPDDQYPHAGVLTVV